MNKLSFGWLGRSSLTEELVKPIRYFSIDQAPHGWLMYVTLWREDWTELKIHSEMHDVAERLEVGVLKFELVDSPTGREKFWALPSAFNGQIIASKLVAHEEGTSAESGLVLRAGSEQEITIVPGALPCSIAILGTDSDERDG